jgi:DNA-binding MarR family transcriptional regulator
MSVTNSEQATAAVPRFPEELVASTAFLLKRLGFAAKEQGMHAYEETGLSPYHHAILIALDEDTHETQGSIADALGYDRGQLVGLLDELEERGLVLRRRDPADRRRQIVEMTPEGERELTRLRGISRRLDDDLMSPLDPAEQRKLHELLLRLAEHHLPHCGGTLAPPKR